MNITRTFAAILICLGSFVLAADAQKNTTKRPTTRRPSTTTKSTTIPTLDVRAARLKVSNQLANVDQFVNILGPIAQNIEALDNDARTKKIAQASIDKNEANKKKVVAAIQNLRTGLVSLETDFRTKNDLKRYLPTIQGISELASQSENSAMAGKFVASREPLRTISQKLSDTLAAIPNVEL